MWLRLCPGGGSTAAPTVAFFCSKRGRAKVPDRKTSGRSQDSIAASPRCSTSDITKSAPARGVRARGPCARAFRTRSQLVSCWIPRAVAHRMELTLQTPWGGRKSMARRARLFSTIDRLGNAHEQARGEIDSESPVRARARPACRLALELAAGPRNVRGTQARSSNASTRAPGLEAFDQGPASFPPPTSPPSFPPVDDSKHLRHLHLEEARTSPRRSRRRGARP